MSEKETKNNVQLNGLPASPGLAIGKAYVYQKEKLQIQNRHIINVEDAINELEEAIAKSKKELHKTLSLALEKIGESRAVIFEAQKMILEDQYLFDSVKRKIIKEQKSPELAVFEELSKYQDILKSSSEVYMQERALDIEDVKNRIIKNLQKKSWVSRFQSDVIVVSDSLSPADVVLLSRNHIKGFVIETGGLTSHVAIIARSLNLPAVLGTHDATSKITNEDLLVIDGFEGIVIINPSEDLLQKYREKEKKLSEFDNELSQLRNLPAKTLDGKEIILRANIDVLEELDYLIQNGGQGIGLLRTEQLFDLSEFPDEEEQHKLYKIIADKVFPEKVIIRAFDVGGDKFLPHGIKEKNPFLGWRGIKFLLDNRKIFKTQIKAILRANVNGNVKFMIPMVSGYSEVVATKEIIEECKRELESEGKPFGKTLPFGIMVEVPSTAVMAKEFAKEVDFLSIGTNDLIQFLLAVDRGNDIVSTYYQEFHPAVIRTLYHIIKLGKEGDAMVSMCGEMASDVKATPLLVGLGLDSLSVNPAHIPYIKKIIRNLEFSKAEQLANECLSCLTEKEIIDKIEKFFKENLLQISKQAL